MVGPPAVMLGAGPAPSVCGRQSGGEEDPERRRGRRRSRGSARRTAAGGGASGAVGLQRPARSRAEAGGAAACAPCLRRPCLPGDAVTDPRGRSSRAALRPLHSAAGAVGRPPCAGRERAGGAGPAREGGSARPGPQGRGPPCVGPGAGGRGARRGGGRPGSLGGRRGNAVGGGGGALGGGGAPQAAGYITTGRRHMAAERRCGNHPLRFPRRGPGPRHALGAVLRGSGDLGRPGPERAYRAVEPVFRRRVLHMLLGLARVSPGRGRGRGGSGECGDLVSTSCGGYRLPGPPNLRTITFVTI